MAFLGRFANTELYGRGYHEAHLRSDTAYRHCGALLRSGDIDRKAGIESLQWPARNFFSMKTVWLAMGS